MAVDSRDFPVAFVDYELCASGSLLRQGPACQFRRQSHWKIPQVQMGIDDREIDHGYALLRDAAYT